MTGVCFSSNYIRFSFHSFVSVEKLYLSFVMLLLYLILAVVGLISITSAEEDVLLERLCHPTERRSRKTCECDSQSDSPWGLPTLQIDCSFKDLKSSDFPSDVLPLYAKSFDISWNKLEYVPNFASDSLKVLNIMHNNISELGEQNFQQLTMLRELYVSWNAIQIISTNAFEDLKFIEVVDLSHNNLKEIGFNAFSYLSSLNTLDLSWNRKLNNVIDKHDHDIYSHLGFNTKLGSLKLEKCGLKELRLPEKASLSLLSLRDNNLEEVPNFLPVNLKELDISGNPLTSLLESQTRKLNSLEILFVEDMPELTTVEYNAIAHLSKLRSLSFQNCRRLSSFHEYAFGENYTNRDLKVVSFRGSALRTFNHTLLAVFQQLTELDLNGMPLRCDCEIVWMKALEIETHGRCISPSRLRGMKLTNVREKDFSCDNWPNWVYGCIILFMIILCSGGISLVVLGLRPNRRISMRRKVGSNSPYARVTIEPNRQDNCY